MSLIKSHFVTMLKRALPSPPERAPSTPHHKTTTGEGSGVSGVRLQKQRVTGHSEYSRGAAAVLCVITVMYGLRKL